MGKVTILNQEGMALKNKNTLKFNQASDKKIVPWTFSDRTFVNMVPTGALKETLDALEASGIKDLKVVIVDEKLEDEMDKKVDENKVKTGKKAPKGKELDEFMKETLEGMDPEEREMNLEFWAQTNEKCVTCSRNCRQSSRVTLYQCPQYERKVA